MAKIKTGILIENIDQLNRLPSHVRDEIWVVPGAYRVEIEALNRGYRCFSGHKFVGYGICDEVMCIVNEVKNQSHGSFVDAVVADMLVRIFRYIWLSRVSRDFGGEIKDSNYKIINRRLNLPFFNPIFKSLNEGLDFTTTASYIDHDPLVYTRFIFKENDFLGGGSFFRNIYNVAAGRRNVVYLPIYTDKIKFTYSRWVNECNYISTIMEAYFQAVLNALRNVKVYPSKAYFNYGTARNVGIARALSYYDIPSRLNSHGCMVQYGSGAASEVRALLSKNIYNDFNGVTEVSTRSPLQSKDVSFGKKNIAESLLRAKKIRSNAGRIRVGYVPNFLPLSGNYHGLVPSCYDVINSSEALIREFSGDERFELIIRIKTNNDKNSEDLDIYSPGIDRGIAPLDLKNIIDSSSVNVIDASSMGYSNYMNNVDIVITSGVTSVIFDALERRIPVIFYSINKDNVAPLPLEDFSKILITDEEYLKPAYSINDLKYLKSALIKLMSKMASPNFIGRDDRILSEFVWVK